MLSCSAVLLKDLPQDTAPQLPLPPAAAPTVRPNVNRVLPLLWCSKVDRIVMLSCHALVSKLPLPTCTQTSTCVLCFGPSRTRWHNFLYMLCFFLPCTMKHSDVDVFYIISSPQIRKIRKYIYFVYNFRYGYIGTAKILSLIHI